MSLTLPLEPAPDMLASLTGSELHTLYGKLCNACKATNAVCLTMRMLLDKYVRRNTDTWHNLADMRWAYACVLMELNDSTEEVYRLLHASDWQIR